MVKTVIGLGILGLIIYITVLFGMPIYDYNVFKSDLAEMSTWDTDVKISDEKFKDRVMKYAEESNIPITKEDIVLFQDGDLRNIKTSWTETVSLFNIYEKTYKFDIDTRYEEE